MTMKYQPVNVSTGKDIIYPANTYWRSFKIKDMAVGIGKSCRQNIESPFLILDAEILFQPIEHILHDTDESKQSCSTQSGIANLEKQKEEVFTPSAQIPKPAFPKRTAVTRCCDLLSRIKTLVHKCTNSTSLANLEKTLLSAPTELEDSSNTDAGLTLVAPDTGEKSRKRKSSKSNDKANKKLKLGKLPSVQAKKNHPYNKELAKMQR